MVKRTRRITTVDSYAAYLGLRRGQPTGRDQRRPKTWVILATCTGSAELSRKFGSPLIHIDVADQPEEAVEALRHSRYGCCEPVGLPSEPFTLRQGWDDWALMCVGPEMAGTAELSPGVAIERGSICLRRHAAVPIASLRRSLRSSLSDLRIHEAAWTARAVQARSLIGRPEVIAPRFTPSVFPSTSRCARADDIYVFDPWTGLRKLGSIIAAALLDAEARDVPGNG